MESVVYHASMDVPIGQVTVAGEGGLVRGVAFQGGEQRLLSYLSRLGLSSVENPERLAPAIEAMEAYFSRGEAIRGLTTEAASGSPFRRRVWEALSSIPHGEVRSYKWLAEKAGNPRAFRAVGAANGANPIPIIIPCHRVINADGRLGGYSGGLSIKRQLLEIEGVHFDDRGYISLRSSSSP